jgi:hypothetical protein
MKHCYRLGMCAIALLLNFLFFSSCQKDIIDVSKTVVPTTVTTPDITSIDPIVYSHIEADAESQSQFIYAPVTNSKYLIGNRGWQGVPTIESLGTDLYTSWYAGPTGEELGNYITVSVSSDKGVTWNNDQLIIVPDNDNSRLFDQSLWKDKYGNLHLSWSISTGFVINGPTLKVWNIMIKRENNKIVITKPVAMFPGMMICKPTPMGKDSSSMLFPMYGPNIGSSATSGAVPADINGAFVYKAGYASNRLTTPSKISKINLDNTIRTYDEHMIVNIDETNLLCALRTTQGLYMCNSSDAGVSWTTPQKFTAIGATCETRSYFGKLKSGNLLLIVNNSTIREKMVAYISKDNGKTWPYSLMLDKRYGNSYPDATQDASGNICVTFDYGRSPYGHILFTKFTENDIITNNTSAISLVKISIIKNP